LGRFDTFQVNFHTQHRQLWVECPQTFSAFEGGDGFPPITKVYKPAAAACMVRVFYQIESIPG
jgi:hypothetical protein